MTGFFRKIFGNQKKEEKKGVTEMSDDERIEYWGKVCEISDIEKRIHHMKELAEAGFGVACICICDGYLELNAPSGVYPFAEVEFWAKKAIELEIPSGHLYLGRVYVRADYPEENDFAEIFRKGAYEYLKAMEYGILDAAVELGKLWSYQNKNIDPSMSEELRDLYRDMIKEGIESEIELLKNKESEFTYAAYGLLYLYGIYFEQNYEAAKKNFVNLARMGNEFGKKMLENPIFLDDEEEE